MPAADTNDPSVAAKRIVIDDGFNLGVPYRGDRPAYKLWQEEPVKNVESIGEEFTI